MKRLLTVLFFIAAATVGCNKDNDPDPDPGTDSIPTPKLEDTLMGWTRVSTGLPGYSDVWFTSQQQGVLSTKEGIYRTVDEGTTWSKVATGYYENLFFLNNKYGYAQGPNDFAYTTNGGITWTERLNTIGQYQADIDLYFATPNTGFLVTTFGVEKTSDTGKNWQRIWDGWAEGIYFRDNFNGWMSSDSGKLYKTNDAGVTWTKVYDLHIGGIPITNIAFPDVQHGKFAGGYVFAKSDDGGVTWTKKQFPSILYDMQFLDANVGYVTTSFEIFKTVDGGNTWTRICGLGTAPLYEIHFTDSNNGWATGALLTLLHWKQ